MLLSIGVGILVTAILVIASIVIANNSASKLNRAFALFSYITSFWITVNYIGANFKDHAFARYFVHADFFSGSILVLSLWLFTLVMFNQVDKQSRFRLIQNKCRPAVSIITFCAGLSTFFHPVTDIVFSGRTTVIEYHHYFIVYSVALLILVIASVANMIISLHFSKGELRQQIFTMLLGLTAAVLFVALTNLLLPILIKSDTVNLVTGNLAYLGIAMFIGATFYSIVKHKLFDIRLLIARAVAYTLSLTTFTAIYVGAAVIISDFLIKDYRTSPKQLLITLGLLFLIVTTINPVRNFFNKHTNRYFYRDAYDPQLFLDELNKIAIDNVELRILLRHAAKLIEDNLKCEKAVFIIYDQDHLASPSLIGSASIDLEYEPLKDLKANLSPDRRLIMLDSLTSQDKALSSIMRKNKLSFITNIQPYAHQNDQTMVYLGLGAKKTGNAYGLKDIQVVGLITNVLTVAVQNALRFQEIQSFNSTLQDRINKAIANVSRANKKLEALDVAKDDFISMASHQLRTPLTSVKGYISMVMEGDAGEITEQQQKLLKQAFNSSQRMVYIISDLLNVSRLRTGKFIMGPSIVNLADVVEQELDQLSDVAESHEVKLIYKKPENFPDLMLDETKTRQVIMNFVDNAIYYTKPKGKIEISLTDEVRSVELRVKDNGIGVPRNEQHHLFTKFYRAGNARVARPDGTGLGLFMAKKVIVGQHGSIIFESQEGKGSTFGFTLDKSELLPKAAKTTTPS